MNFVAMMLTAVGLTLPAFAQEKPQDSNGVQGTWLPSKAELGGKAMGSNFLTNTVLKLDQGKYEVTVAGAADKGTYTIDPSLRPKTIDITGTEGPNVGKTFPAIYELQGETLRICYSLGDSPRPTEFKSPPGTQIFLVTYQRKKAN